MKKTLKLWRCIPAILSTHLDRFLSKLSECARRSTETARTSSKVCQKFRERYTYCASEWAILVPQSAWLSNRNGTKQGSKSRAQLVRCGDLLEGWRGVQAEPTNDRGRSRRNRNKPKMCRRYRDVLRRLRSVHPHSHTHTQAHALRSHTHIAPRPKEQQSAHTFPLSTLEGRGWRSP